MKIYTYFDATPGMSDQAPLIALWERSWRAYGWEPQILFPRIAEQHPLFKEFHARVNTYPTVNNRAYENACYHRWLALAQVGGGWMSDYDVMNFGMRPHTRKLAFELPERNYVPAVSFTTSKGVAQAVELLMSYGPEAKWPAQPGHISDMLIFQNRLIKGRDLGEEKDIIIREYNEPDWKGFPLTHFSAGVCRQAGRSNKVDAILHCGRRFKD